LSQGEKAKAFIRKHVFRSVAYQLNSLSAQSLNSSADFAASGPHLQKSLIPHKIAAIGLRRSRFS
jgi:hypothetical protein